MKVKITADSTCDLSPELVKRYDIAIIPLTVTLGNRSGHDGCEVTPDDIYAYVDKSGHLPQSSAVNVDEYITVFRNWIEQGYQIVHFCISSQFSRCYQNACLAAKETGSVWVVDTQNLSSGQGLAVLYGADLASAGCTPDEIAQQCNATLSRIEASFVVDSIDYLRKGGRCSPLAAFGANVFHIKPCIEVIDGHMEPRKKYRGEIQKVIRQYVEDRLKGRTDIQTDRIFVTHTKCDEETVDNIISLIRELQPEMEEIHETIAGATVTTHCGAGTLGVLFVRKS